MMMNGQDLEKALRSEEMKALKQFTLRASILLATIEENREEGLHPYEDAEGKIERLDEAMEAVDFEAIKRLFCMD